MSKRVIAQRDVVIPFCEGEAEIKLLGFLKSRFLIRNCNIEFRSSIDLGGLSDFAAFQRTYQKEVKKIVT